MSKSTDADKITAAILTVAKIVELHSGKPINPQNNTDTIFKYLLMQVTAH